MSTGYLCKTWMIVGRLVGNLLLVAALSAPSVAKAQAECGAGGAVAERGLFRLWVGTQGGADADGAKVFSYTAGCGWVDLTPNGLGGAAAVMDLAFYADHVYAAVQTEHGRDTGEGRVWRYQGGTVWADVTGLVGGNSVQSLSVFRGALYAGTWWNVGAPQGASGHLFRCVECLGSDWSEIDPGIELGDGLRSSVVSTICGEPELFLGSDDADLIWRFRGYGDFQLVLEAYGSCIWSLAEFEGRIYAGASIEDAGGPVYRTWPDLNCNSGPPWFENITTTGKDNWAMEVFRGQLYLGTGEWVAGDYGARLSRYDPATNSWIPVYPTDPPNGSFPATTLDREGVISLAAHGDEHLYVGLGYSDGLNYYWPDFDGRGEVWRYDGNSDPVRISGEDQFGGGAQCLLVTESAYDCNNNDIPDECECDFDGDLVPDDCKPNYCMGDANCDGQLDFGDINPFVRMITDPVGWQQQYPGCPFANGDINRDCAVGFGDINLFVALLASAPLPIPCD
jgi:hypothetical protein